MNLDWIALLIIRLSGYKNYRFLFASLPKSPRVKVSLFAKRLYLSVNQVYWETLRAQAVSALCFSPLENLSQVGCGISREQWPSRPAI